MDVLYQAFPRYSREGQHRATLLTRSAYSGHQTDADQVYSGPRAGRHRVEGAEVLHGLRAREELRGLDEGRLSFHSALLWPDRDSPSERELVKINDSTARV